MGGKKEGRNSASLAGKNEMSQFLNTVNSQRSQGTSTEQLAVVAAIRRARNRHPGCGPSYRELATDLGVSINDVYGKVARLCRDGIVTIDAGVARSLRIVGE